MNPLFFAVLHAGHGQELTLLAYLYRVLLHLLALGGVVVLLAWATYLIEAVRSAYPQGRE